jgi:hypothetical protein
MADIAMCKNIICPSFKKCYRAQATPNPYRQGYMLFDYGDKDKCDEYRPLTTHKEKDK